MLNESTSSQFERMPPHSIESEMCVIASMLLDKEAAGDICGILTTDDFFQADHSILFDLIRSLRDAGRAVDGMIIREELDKRQQLEEIGGLEYLSEILSAVPDASHGATYARVVKEKALLRQIIKASNDNLQDAYAPHNDATEVLQRAESRMFAIAEHRDTRGAVALGDVVIEAFESLESKATRGVETGYAELDDMLNGLQHGEMIIVAARPSMGKTAIVLNMIESIAGNSGLPVAMMSLEMGREALAARMMASRANVDSHLIRRGMLSHEHWDRLAKATTELQTMPIYVDDSSSLTLYELRTKARRLKLQQGIRALFIDYIQLMEGSGEKDRQQQISTISRGIKGIARELDIPVVALSQLNRQLESREDRRPRMSDLRESGSLEQDADVIILLHREDYYHIGDESYEPTNVAELIVAKQRNGPTGTVKLVFDRASTQFRNMSASHNPQDPF